MILSLAYSLARFLTKQCLVRRRSDAQLRAEVHALRHQLSVLERQLGKPRWQPGSLTGYDQPPSMLLFVLYACLRLLMPR